MLAKDRRGVAALEFALTGSLLLSMILGTVAIGRALAAQHALGIGVERAARYAVVRSATSASPASAADIGNQFYATVQPLLGAGGGPSPNPTVSVAYAGAGNIPGGLVTVSAFYSWQPLSGFDGLPAMTLSAAVSYTIQN